jgi:hypothetical protein
MWPFGRKPKRIIVKRYRAFGERSARRKFERDANRMAERGYRIQSSADKSHKWSTQRGDIFVTYERDQAPK